METNSGQESAEAAFFVPSVEEIVEVKQRLDMEVTISTGQRKIGPPASFSGLPAKHECFLGSLSRAAMEPELLKLLETVESPIHDVRLMMCTFL